MSSIEVPSVLQVPGGARHKYLHDILVKQAGHLHAYVVVGVVGDFALIHRRGYGAGKAAYLRALTEENEVWAGGSAGTLSYNLYGTEFVKSDPLMERLYAKTIGYIPGSAIRVGDVYVGWSIPHGKLRVCATEVGGGQWFYSEKEDDALGDHLRDAIGRADRRVVESEKFDDLCAQWESEQRRRVAHQLHDSRDQVVTNLVHAVQGPPPPTKQTPTPTTPAPESDADTSSSPVVSGEEGHWTEPWTIEDLKRRLDEYAKTPAMHAYLNDYFDETIPTPAWASDPHVFTAPEEGTHQEHDMTDTDATKSDMTKTQAAREFGAAALAQAGDGLKKGAAKAVADEAVIALVKAIDNPMVSMVMTNRWARTVAGLTIAGGLGLVTSVFPTVFGGQTQRVRAVSLQVFGGYAAVDGARLFQIGMDKFVKPTLSAFMNAAAKRGVKGDPAMLSDSADSDPFAGFSDGLRAAAEDALKVGGEA